MDYIIVAYACLSIGACLGYILASLFLMAREERDVPKESIP